MFNLSDKTFNTLSKIQKVLLALMVLASIGMVIFLLLPAGGMAAFGNFNAYAFALLYLVFALAMTCGFIYANKGYSKQANGYYKAMMCLYALTAVFSIIAGFRHSGFGLATIVAIIKFILLLILGLGKDLGKKNTWIIFYIYLVLELVFAPALQLADPISSTIIPATLARLVITGIIGLCIEAKYRDKDARGTV